MHKRQFFEYWYDSFRITRATIEHFPEEELGRILIPGLRPPGQVYAHIFAHVNGVFNACVRRELLPAELLLIPADVDTTRAAPLVRYAQRTMEGLLAHGSLDDQAWKQLIKTPWGEVPMESLCLESFAHEIHHRGQLYAMLRILGITPAPVCRHEWPR
jgi:uncharacterized damage-inducible protein DinB